MKSLCLCVLCLCANLDVYHFVVVDVQFVFHVYVCAYV